MGLQGHLTALSELLLSQGVGTGPPLLRKQTEVGTYLSPTNIQTTWEITPRGVEIDLEEDLVQLPSRETEAQLGEARGVQGERADLLGPLRGVLAPNIPARWWDR